MIKHLVQMVGITILIVLGVIYPFLPGQYDSLAVPLSTMAQAGAAVGLLLVPIGLLWLAYEARKQAQTRRGQAARARRYYFALAAWMALSLVALVVSLVAYATVGLSMALLALAIWLLALARLFSKLKLLKAAEAGDFSPAPLYLVLIPIAIILVQLSLAAPLTSFSRSHAIASSTEFVDHLEAYHTRYNRYPTSLLAMWKDYYPDVVGIEKFHYTPGDNAYNLSFEQPRFFFDNLGTREWVVYNPRDEHRMFSHTAWFLLLTPDELERSQGWYAVHDTAHPHWRYFWFD
jgi:hypothetical protein